MCICPTCIYVHHIHAGELNPLGLELQMVVKCYVGAGYKTWVL